MGWSYGTYSGNFENFVKSQFQWENKEQKQVVLDYALIRMRELYVAVDATDKSTGIQQVKFGVTLIRFVNGEIGVKSVGLDDDYVRCPIRLLKLFPEKHAPAAQQWVTKCYQFHLEHKRSPIRNGDLCFSVKGIRFSNGTVAHLFRKYQPYKNARKKTFEAFCSPYRHVYGHEQHHSFTCKFNSHDCNVVKLFVEQMTDEFRDTINQHNTTWLTHQHDNGSHVFLLWQDNRPIAIEANSSDLQAFQSTGHIRIPRESDRAFAITPNRALSAPQLCIEAFS